MKQRRSWKLKITLNETDQRLAEFLGKKRYEHSRENKITDRKIGGQSNYITDLEGVAGEIAFCKLHNVFPICTDIGKREYYDLLSPTLGTVDVKTTKYSSGRLLVTLNKKNKEQTPDTYVLMTGCFPTYHCRGYMAASDLLKDANIIDLGMGETYGVEQDRLIQVIALPQSGNRIAY